MPRLRTACIRLAGPAAALVAALLLAASPGIAVAPKPLAACFSDWPPYAYTKDGIAAGLSVRAIGEAARRAGIQASFTQLPWARCLNDVEQGRFDVALDGQPRPTLINGRTPHPVVVVGAFVRGDIGRPVDGLAGLRGLVFGHPVGWAIPVLLQPMLEAGSIPLVRPPGRAQVVEMMKHGRVDFAYDAYAEFPHVAREAGADVVPVPGTVNVSLLYPLVTPGRPALRDRLDASLADMAADGTLDRMYLEEVGISRSGLLAAGPSERN